MSLSSPPVLTLVCAHHSHSHRCLSPVLGAGKLLHHVHRLEQRGFNLHWRPLRADLFHQTAALLCVQHKLPKCSTNDWRAHHWCRGRGRLPGGLFPNGWDGSLLEVTHHHHHLTSLKPISTVNYCDYLLTTLAPNGHFIHHFFIFYLSNLLDLWLISWSFKLYKLLCYLFYNYIFDVNIEKARLRFDDKPFIIKCQ